MSNPSEGTSHQPRQAGAATDRRAWLCAGPLNEALETILFRQRSYEAIARLKANPDELADYQRQAREWAEIDVAGWIVEG